MDDISALTAVEARRLIGRRRLSPEALLEACIGRIERLDPAVNAMVTRAFDRARDEARAAGRAVMAGDDLGPLHGLPVAIKDIQDTRGIRTTYGSIAHRDHVPKTDEGIVARLRAAGGIVIGKTNIPEFSIGANTVNRLFGATGNPFDVSLSAGGSSGGSAVALATHMAPLATGSDHGGSLRIPACFAGVVGYRASPGVVPHERRPLTQSFYSTQGPMARNVADAALLLSVVAGRNAGGRDDPMAFPLEAGRFAALEPVDLSGLCIAVTEDLGGALVSQPIRAAFRDRVARFAGLFKSCDWHAIDLRDASDIDWRLRSDFFVAQYYRDIDQFDDGFNPNILNNYRAALATPMADIAKARRRQMDLFQRFRSLFDRFDLVICPGVGVSPFPWRDLYPREVDGEPVANYMAWLGLTAAITVVGHPVVALPCGTDAAGLPFGLQVIGPIYHDHALLSAARMLEQAFADDPATRRPIPDPDKLAATESDCRTLGKTVAS